MFVMTQWEGEEQLEENETMLGMRPVFNITTLGVSHSFISDSFRKRFGSKYYDSIEELEVSIP